MTEWLDAYPLDWSMRELRQLRDTLADIYLRPDPITEMARRAGVSPGLISWELEPRLLWRSVITVAREHERLRELLAEAAAADPRAAAALEGLLGGDEPGEERDRT